MTDLAVLDQFLDDIADAQHPAQFTADELARILSRLNLAIVPCHTRPAATLGDPWAAARRLRDVLAGHGSTVPMDHLTDALSRLNLAVVPRSAVGVDRGQTATAAVPVANVRALCARLERLCESVDSVPVESIEHVFLADPGVGVTLPRLAPTAGTDRVRAAATGQAVVIGQHHDRSGLSDTCYGPYDATRAEAVASLLNDGNWYSMQWLAMPVGVLPGGET